MIEKLATLLPWKRNSNDVRIRYKWDVRWRLWAQRVIIYCDRPLRAVLLWYDRATTFRAEGHDDLAFSEWFAIKWCEWHKRHVGYRQTIGGMRYCSHCRCHWEKLQQRYDADGKRRK